MQIEQVIGGVTGNTSSQAIQLRMRAAGQGEVSQSKVWAADENGANRVLLLDITTNVATSTAGSRILLTTPSFTQYMINNGSATFAPDFTLASQIPASYLSAGRLTFEDDGGSVATPGTILWSLSWGGDNYTGPTTAGNFTNDINGNFGPSFPSPLPTATRAGVRFTAAFSAGSNSNFADYALTSDPATVIKNSGVSFVLPAAFIAGDYDGDMQITIADYNAWKLTYGTMVTAFTGADGNGDTIVNAADYTVWRNKLNTTGAGQGAGEIGDMLLAVPEPSISAILFAALLASHLHRRR